MKWITRSHVHVDRVACPWLVTRFIDSDAEFLFVPKSKVLKKGGNQSRPFFILQASASAVLISIFNTSVKNLSKI